MGRKNKIYLVAGLGFGDEGKGSIVDYLARREGVKAIIRYNGGAQSGHRVQLPDGREHIFAQFGSGSFLPEVLTFLSKFMLIEPIGMIRENEHLKEIGFNDVLERTVIDGNAPIITPFHIAANRFLEIVRGKNRRGSCGLGIGELMEDIEYFKDDVIRMKDLEDSLILKKKLFQIRDRKLYKIKDKLNSLSISKDVLDEYNVFKKKEIIEWCLECYSKLLRNVKIIKKENYLNLFLKSGTIIFEGAQGMLLDKHYGFYPFLTKTDISYCNAYNLIKEANYGGKLIKIGIIRGYLTRHGRGPFVTEDKNLSKYLLINESNQTNKWQGEFRLGYFDIVAIKYALEAIGGVDELAITNLDKLFELPDLKICIGYIISDLKSGNKSIKHLQVFSKESRFCQTGYFAQLLKQAKPIYETLKTINNEESGISYAYSIANYLRIKPVICSFGPTYLDKIML